MGKNYHIYTNARSWYGASSSPLAAAERAALELGATDVRRRVRDYDFIGVHFFTCKSGNETVVIRVTEDKEGGVR